MYFLGRGKGIHSCRGLTKEKKNQKNTCPNLERGATRAGPSGGEQCRRRGQMHPTGALNPIFCYYRLGAKQPSMQQTREPFLAPECSGKVTFLFLVLPHAIHEQQAPWMKSIAAMPFRRAAEVKRMRIFNNMFKKGGLFFSSSLPAPIWTFRMRWKILQTKHFNESCGKHLFL